MKKLFKVLIWLAGIFVALLILLIIGFKLFFPVDKAREMAVAKGSEMLGRPVSIGSIDLSIWGGLGLKLEKAAVGNPEAFGGGEFLTADNVDLKLELLPLIRGEYRIDRLIINSPHILMRKTKEGQNNYTFKMAEKAAPPGVSEALTPEAKTAGIAVSFKKFEIANGLIEFTDDSSNLSMKAHGVSLSTSVENPESGRFNSSGQLALDSLFVNNSIKLPPIAIQLRYQAEFDMNELALDLESADLKVNKLPFHLTGNYIMGDTAVGGRLYVQSQGAPIADLLQLVPAQYKEHLAGFKFSGELGIDADLVLDKARKQSFVYSGSLKLNGVTVAHDSVPGELQFKRAVLDIKPNNARLNIEDGTFDGKPIKGRLTIDNFDDPDVSGELAGSLNLEFITPFLPEAKSKSLGGEAKFDVLFAGKPKEFEKAMVSGNLSIVNGSFSSPDLPEPIDSLQFDAYFDNAVTRINSLSGRIPSGAFTFTGRINDLLPYLMADSNATPPPALTLTGNFDGRLALAFFERYLPQEGEPKLKGDIHLNLTLSGSTAVPERMISVGEVQINNAAYSDKFLPEKLTRFDAAMSLTPDTITVTRMDAKFESSDVSFTGKLADPFPYLLPIKDLDRSQLRKPLFLFKLAAHRFDVDRLFPEAAPGTGVNRAAMPPDSVSMILLPDIDGKGSFDIDTVVYSQVEFTSLKGDVKIYDRKIECYNVTGDVYSGKVSGTTTIDLNNFAEPVYSGDFKATDIEANDFVSRFSKFGGHLFGKVGLTGNYRASGWNPESFLNSLSMESDADMRSGKVVTSGSFQSTIGGLAQKLGESFDKEQDLKQLATKITVKDGKVLLDDLNTKLGTIGDVTVGGSYSFTGALDYKGSILLSRDLTEKLMSKGSLMGGLKGLLGGKSVERVRLPILIKGTADKPDFNIDYSAIGQSLGEDAKGQAENLLKGLFKK